MSLAAARRASQGPEDRLCFGLPWPAAWEADGQVGCAHGPMREVAWRHGECRPHVVSGGATSYCLPSVPRYLNQEARLPGLLGLQGQARPC